MRDLADRFVKSEFRLHRNVKDTKQIAMFLQSWEQYAEQLQKRNGGRVGQNIDEDVRRKHFSAEQNEKLAELRHEVKRSITEK